MKSLIVLLVASGIAANEETSTRIVGGEQAPFDRFPYYSSLYRNSFSRNNFFCGGILVAPDFVLTAAHCDTGGIKVAVGNTDLDADGTKRNVIEKFSHESYNSRTIANDIMLLQLSSPVSKTAAILNFDKSFPIPKEELTAIGLGRLSENGPSPEKLYYVRKDEYPFDNCEDAYSLGGIFGDLFSKMDEKLQICAGGDGDKDSCFGDSGGPLVKEGRSDGGEDDILVGLTSYGRGCAREGYPGVYTRISGYEDWIKTRICGNTSANPKPDYCNNYVPPPGSSGGSGGGGGGGVGGGFFCFSGIDTVEVENVGTVEMKSLNIGDSILVAPNKYEPVYSFGHRSDVLETEFLKVVASNGAKLEITKDHLVFVDKDVSVPASDLKHGMQLLHSGELASVKSIKTVVRKGLYAPFTPSGKLVVNGFEVSSFVAINGSATVKLFGMELHYQTVSSLFESPRRLVCHVFGKCTEETYNEDGMSTWHSVALKSYQWLLDQNMVTFHVGFTFAFLVVGLVSAFELFVTSTVALPLIMCVSLILARKYTSAKKTN